MTIETSIFVESQIPAFLREDAENLRLFLEAYYEYLEQTNQTLDVSKNLLSYQDIDKTTDEYFEFFRREILNSLPLERAADKTITAKNIRDLYLSRGSKKSFELLFRLLYNETITLQTPGDFILRASDGRWTEEVRVTSSLILSGNVEDFEGQKIVGEDTEATAIVDRIENYYRKGVQYYDLYLINIEGEFADNEVIRNSANTVTARLNGSLGPCQAVDVLSGGRGHFVGEKVNIISGRTGQGAEAQVTEISDTDSCEFYILDGGSGYTVNSTITINQGSGSGASFIITEISNTETINVFVDTISTVANVDIFTDSANTLDDEYGDSPGSKEPPVASPSLQSANVDSSVGGLEQLSVTVGTISKIVTTSVGYGYNLTLPAANVVNEDIDYLNIPDGNGGFKGKNAKIESRYVGGSIRKAKVTNQGRDYRKGEVVSLSSQVVPPDSVTRVLKEESLGEALLLEDGFRLLDEESASSLETPKIVDATAYPQVTALQRLLGRYTDIKGFPSSEMRIQDNEYYQEFSYEIASQLFSSKYDRIVDLVCHPSGTKRFDRLNIFANNIVEPLTEPNSFQRDIKFNSQTETAEVSYSVGSEAVMLQNDSTLNANTEVANAEVILYELTAIDGRYFVQANSQIGYFGSNTFESEIIFTPYSAGNNTVYGQMPVDFLGTDQLLIGNTFNGNTPFLLRDLPSEEITFLIREQPSDGSDLFEHTSKGTYANNVLLVLPPVESSANLAILTKNVL